MVSITVNAQGTRERNVTFLCGESARRSIELEEGGMTKGSGEEQGGGRGRRIGKKRNMQYTVTQGLKLKLKGSVRAQHKV